MNSGNSHSSVKVLLFCFFAFGCQVLGVWGFILAGEAPHFPSLLYKSLQLFSMESGAVDGPVPWQLEIARWIAPLTLAGGLFGLAQSILAQRFGRYKARRLRGHHIVCGLGEKGLALSSDLLGSGNKVVALDPSPDAELLGRFLQCGGLHLPLEITAPPDLELAGIKRAATFTALTPDDARNLAVALAMETAESKGDPNNKLRIFTHIGSVAFRDLLDRNAFLGATPHGPSTVRSFNSHANLARLLFREFPFETAGYPDGSVNTGRAIHAVFPVMEAEATAMIVHAARTGHYLAGRKIHFHVVGAGASLAVRKLLANYPSFERCCASLTAVDIPGGPDFGHAVGNILREHNGACFTVFPCFDAAPEHLATILHIHEQSPLDMPFRMPLPGGIRYLLEPAATRIPVLASRVVWFPDVRHYCGKEAVFNDQLDRVARIIHDNWYSETRRQILAAEAAGDLVRADTLRNKPAYRVWHGLAEDQKDVNRSQADHIDVKVRAAGLDPQMITKSEWAEWCNSNPETMDHIARAEHDRWAAHLWLSGWSSGGPRDDSRKLHDNLLPYDELDESTKQYDRNSVKHLDAHK